MATVIVAGITRSGLSLTMQMLQAGGFQCKGESPAFEPFGIGRVPWGECDGYAVKLVDAHLQLPQTAGKYRVIRLSRNLKQQALSFNKWNAAFGLPAAPVANIIGSMRRDYKIIDEWAERYSPFWFQFEELIEKPVVIAERLNQWLGGSLDVDRMVSVIIPRTSDCHPELLELRLIEKAIAEAARS